MLQRLIRSPRWTSLAVGFVVFFVYWKTLAPTAGFIDSGELAAVACTLGVAHPTGYPLFTLLGWIFSRLPIASEEVVRLNLMAALLCALGAVMFFSLLRFLLTKVSSSDSSGVSPATEFQSSLINASSAGASLILAFSETFWSQAVSVEVYSLHIFFLALVLVTFMKANFYSETSGSARPVLASGALWALFSFSVGLSFTNHMTTVLLAPGLIYLYVATQGFTAASWKRLGLMGVPFLLGLSVYMYLPIRAAQSPALNWGNTATLEKFLWHLSGKQYRVWIFSSTESAARQLEYFVSTVPEEFAYIGIALAVVGLTYLMRSHRLMFIGTVLLFVTCVSYSINYDIHDIDSYFLLAYFCTALWAGFGILIVGSWLVARRALKKSVVLGLMPFLGFIPCAFHYGTNDESTNYLVEDYTTNMFASFEPNALVLSYQWDYWVSASYYHQLVKGVRSDVAVVDKELLRRSWYLVSLERRYPWLIEESKAELEAFRRELYKFEHDIPYDPRVIESRYVEMILGFIREGLRSRPVYVTSEIEQEFTQGLQRVPEGLAYRLYADTVFHPSKPSHYVYRQFARSGRLEGMIHKLYARSLLDRGIYYYRWGDRSEARSSFVRALEVDPTSADAQRWLGVMQ